MQAVTKPSRRNFIITSSLAHLPAHDFFVSSAARSLCKVYSRILILLFYIYFLFPSPTFSAPNLSLSPRPPFSPSPSSSFTSRRLVYSLCFSGPRHVVVIPYCAASIIYIYVYIERRRNTGLHAHRKVEARNRKRSRESFGPKLNGSLTAHGAGALHHFVFRVRCPDSRKS